MAHTSRDYFFLFLFSFYSLILGSRPKAFQPNKSFFVGHYVTLAITTCCCVATALQTALCVKSNSLNFNKCRDLKDPAVPPDSDHP